jgi:hypothetical protein
MVLALLRRNGSGTSDAAMGFAAKELQGLPIDAALGKEMLCSALKDGMLGLGVSSPKPQTPPLFATLLLHSCCILLHLLHPTRATCHAFCILPRALQNAGCNPGPAR